MPRSRRCGPKTPGSRASIASVRTRCCTGSMWHSQFFRRIKSGEPAGYPRFKPAARWKQLEFPHGGRALKLDRAQKRVRIPGVGTVSLRKGRAIPAFGRAFVAERNGRWWAIFECGREPQALPLTGRVVGIDRGVHVLAATSDGELLRNGKHGERLRRIARGHQRALEAVSG